MIKRVSKRDENGDKLVKETRGKKMKCWLSVENDQLR